MRFSALTMVLSTLALGQATAASLHGKSHNHAMKHAEQMRSVNEARDIAKRDTSLLSAADSDKLKGIGLPNLGLNPTTAGSIPWIGAGGSLINEFFCQDAQNCTVVLWGPAGSWVNAVTPQLTISITHNTSTVVSFPNGWSGAWSMVDNTTELVMGQVSNTWGEGTVNHPYSTFDVSREVNANGKNMRIVTPKCTTDMTTCVFNCPPGVKTCTTGYTLDNCDPKVQSGANYGTYGGAPSGGCSGLAEGDTIKTYLGYST